ncbi:unannotated protein [freshwater metagenome]|uniref:Unannotated protein n=1 Tax=freshwater metagenome TaxID=449393 RepID=A0A6J5Z8R9_9ZZZZ|nr:DUF2087 domain-containing protein [Actinomycetota bacterium]
MHADVEKIEQFFREDGTLISIPAKSSKRLAVLNRIAGEFSARTKYSEKELNEIVARFHEDTAAIRRYMIENGIMERDRESVYWLAERN